MHSGRHRLAGVTFLVDRRGRGDRGDLGTIGAIQIMCGHNASELLTIRVLHGLGRLRLEAEAPHGWCGQQSLRGKAR